MHKNLMFIVAGIALFAAMLHFPVPHIFTPSGWKVIAVIVLMLTWWVSEAVPIPVTALLPIILFPLLEITPLKAVTSNYGHPIVFLFFGGFTIALAMQKWNLHKRIALGIVRMTGTHANGIILGFMLATAFLSMWISNTATTVMMLPIGLSVLGLITGKGEGAKSDSVFCLSLMIAIAYAANIGGTATLTGTPPNAIFAGFMENEYGLTIDFATWTMVGIPFALVMLLLCWCLMCFVVYPNKLGNIEGAKEFINKEYALLGRMGYAECWVLIIFVSTALLWVFKGILPLVNLKDAMIAMAAAISLFLIPLRNKSGFLLNWDDMRALPWGILLLFGGGLSIAGAMRDSGIIELVGSEISGLSGQGLFVVLVAVIAAVLFLTECMSNLALITIFLPVLAGVALKLGENPLLFAIPATLAASCAFMLPMATPPNAIVFSSGYIRIPQMIKIGIWLNLVSVLLITAFSYTVIAYVFGVEIGNIPTWAMMTR